jgi:4-methyl-5(b-hydroxyethyl)-thiazole monophosphate biosynthesis
MKALVLLADGFEEIEATAIIDVLRRAGITVETAALATSPVMGSHGIAIVADGTLSDVKDAAFDAVVLPGGMPGSKNLKEDPRVLSLLGRAASSGKVLAALCAAPIALEAAGVLAGKRATAYPGYELPSARYSEDRVVVDGNVITSRGPGTALEFSLSLVQKLLGPDAAEKLRERMLVQAPAA